MTKTDAILDAVTTAITSADVPAPLQFRAAATHFALMLQRLRDTGCYALPVCDRAAAQLIGSALEILQPGSEDALDTCTGLALAFAHMQEHELLLTDNGSDPDAAAQTVHACDNCDFTTTDPANLLTVQCLSQRVLPGETMPSGECPECGALVFPQ